MISFRLTAALLATFSGTLTLHAAFPIPLPSPVPANETPFANLQPGQDAVLKNITTNAPNDDTKACSIRLSQKFDKSGQEHSLNFSWVTGAPYEYATGISRTENDSMRFTGFGTGSTVTTTVCDAVPMSENEKRFLRLRIVQP
jgi:hypothetical protein